MVSVKARTRDRLIMILFAYCMGFQKIGLIWEHKARPSWRDRVFKAIGITAYCLGWLVVILWFLVRYLTGPLIVYLMLRYWT